MEMVGETVMFEGFETRRVRVEDCVFHLRTGGEGPPVLLLHGFPQTHRAWAPVAGLLRDRYRLVIPDTPGQGETEGPEPTPENFSKRRLAVLCRRLMEALGHPRFHLAGHDRGGRIGYRMALDAPEVVLSFAALDIVPTLEVWEAMRWRSALSGYHWLLLAQPAPLPETLVGADGPGYVHHLIDRWAGHRDRLEPEAVAAYADSYRKPSVVAAACADYRAGATLDREHDVADLEAGRKLAMPCRLVWGERYLVAKGAGPLETWRRWAERVDEVPLDVGHFVAEEAPEETARALDGLFAKA